MRTPAPPSAPPLNASAAGATVSYALSGPDAANFNINPATGEVSLARDVSPDFEAKPQYSLIVTATADITVQILNVDEPGAVTLSTDAPGAGETITAVLSDPDGEIANIRWSWARSGDDWNVISGTTAASYTTTTPDIGYRIEATANYDDGAGVGHHANAATANPVRNDPPAFPDGTATRQVDENATAGTPVGTLVTATDPNGDGITYSVAGSADFAIDPNTGQISAADGTSLDHEAQAAHAPLTVTATDSPRRPPGTPQ